MAAKQFKNFIQHRLTVAISTTGQTVLTFDSVAGWATTGDWPMRLDDPTLSTTEIVFVTSVNVGANQVTVTRAQEGTSAALFPVNSTGGNEFTAQAIADALVRLDTAVSQTLTGPLVIPPKIGVVAPATSYGTLPVKLDDQLLGASTASITFLNPLPTGFRHLLIEWFARGDTVATSTPLILRFNNDSGANYDYQFKPSPNNPDVAWLQDNTTRRIP